MVKEFHMAFGMPVLEPCQQITKERLALRKKLIEEEYEEYREAADDYIKSNGPLSQVMKEACDLLYVVLGAHLETGTPSLVSLAKEDLNDELNLTFYIEYLKNSKGVRFEMALRNITCVLLQALSMNGLWDDFPRAFHEVHRSNMSKLGTDGKPIYREDGKVLKGPNYSPADLTWLDEK